MGGDGARDKDWLRAREHHLFLTDTISYFFLVSFFLISSNNKKPYFVHYAI